MTTVTYKAAVPESIHVLKMDTYVKYYLWMTVVTDFDEVWI